ncbi:MAG: Gfo/Idh/MocA family oxidoreductase [Ardenticatenales bacterium]|nr:Gfo/Idh/MocA family oxidoreductase [Ardenticatenales bacterium]
MKKLRVGVIGVGAIATDEIHGHIPNYLQIPDVELVAISDVNGRRAQHIADRFGIPQVYTHYRDMLAHTEVDAVSIAVPNYLHATIAIGCLELGVSVLVEKPMALTAHGAHKMIQAAKKSGKTLFVGMNNRFRDDTRALKLMVQQGALGDVYYAKAGWLRRVGASTTSSWFTSKAQAGGGPLWDTGLVMLDLSLWMLGFPRVRSVSGTIHCPLHLDQEERMALSPFEDLPYPIEDSATALIRFHDLDTALLLEVSTLSMLGISDDIYLRLDGTGGGAELHNPEARPADVLRIHGELFGTKMEFAPVLPESSIPSHRRELQHFVDVCLGREAPLITPEQGFAGVQVIEAIYRSAELGSAVDLPSTMDEEPTPAAPTPSVAIEAEQPIPKGALDA